MPKRNAIRELAQMKIELEQAQGAGRFLYAVQWDNSACYRYEPNEGAPLSEAEAVARGLAVVDPADYDDSSDTLILFQYRSDWPQV